MKKIYALFIFAFVSLQILQAQVGINTTNPDPSSMLDITSTNSGMLIPRMTESQRDAITAPTKSLLIFQIDETEGFYYWDGITWIPFGGSGTGTGEFISENDVVHNTTDLQFDDFVFGSTQLDNTSSSATDHRMFYDKALAAFRAGEADSDQWDNDNLGLHSTASGKNTIASARSSVAMGEGSIAAGDYSIALGHNAIITSGSSSAVAIGSGATATDNNAIAIGEDTEASETNATAMGNTTKASGKNSFAIGNATEAQGNSSTAMGKQTQASGDNSFAMGLESVASGRTSTAIGDEVTAPSYGELAVGLFNETYVAASATSMNNDDRIFSVGNGLNNISRRNALTILKNGNTGIGTTAPSSTLDVEGTFQLVDGNETNNYILTSDANGNATWQDPIALLNNGAGEFKSIGGVVHNTTDTNDDFVFGSTTLDDSNDNGSNSRFQFDKSTGAFRAGSATGDQWDIGKRGSFSIAMGLNPTASGNNSIALGQNALAARNHTIAIGSRTITNHNRSTAIGYQATTTDQDQIMLGRTGVKVVTPGTIEASSMTASGRVTANDFEASLSSTIYADYVFEDFFDGYSKINPNYKFKTIEETEKFVKENRHLPGVVSYEDVMRNGNTINLSETSINNLEKIEEQFLYITTLNKTLEEHQESIKALNQKLNKIIENYSIDNVPKK